MIKLMNKELIKKIRKEDAKNPQDQENFNGWRAIDLIECIEIVEEGTATVDVIMHCCCVLRNAGVI